MTFVFKMNVHVVITKFLFIMINMIGATSLAESVKFYMTT